jgi:hypothetical protein
LLLSATAFAAPSRTGVVSIRRIAGPENVPAEMCTADEALYEAKRGGRDQYRNASMKPRPAAAVHDEVEELG